MGVCGKNNEFVVEKNSDQVGAKILSEKFKSTLIRQNTLNKPLRNYWKLVAVFFY